MMNDYRRGDWLEHSDAPQEDKDDYRALDDKPMVHEDDPDTGGVAGCVFGLALIVLCVVLVYLFAQTGGAW